MRVTIEDDDYEPIIDITIEQDMNTHNYPWTASKPGEWHCHEGTIYNHDGDNCELVQKVLTSIGYF